jgi:two-component system, OmpR family, alkaline phosphatase synthesis response regulator PhoP
VPVRSKSSNADPPQPSIVLLEEYDALAAAISSALKKFASQHIAVVARSLGELEKLAGDLNPELFIFDVDPPWAGLTNLLEQVRDSHPSARALVIGDPIPSEIAAERGSSGALQFIEKPFELATFGAAVQALLGPRAESRGTLRALGPIDALLLHCASNANVTLEVRSRSRTGEIEIAAGQVVHAETGKLKGEEALAEISSWSKPNLSERKMFGSQRRTISSNWPAIVVETLRELQPEIAEPRPVLPDIIQPRTGKNVVVVDDTEMLLIFVEDILATSGLELQITTAPSGTEGVQEIERVVPDLVLLDYSLPDFNGDEVCRRLLENERTADVPVLMMSGHVAQMNSTAARFPNVVATIEKPFLSDALVDLVRRTLASGRTRVEKAISKPAYVAPVVEPAIPPPLPPKQEVKTEPPVRIVREPSSAVEPWTERHKPSVAPSPIRIAPTDGSTAVLGIFLEVLSMQLSSQLQMGAIRAQPASLTASLRLESAAARNAIPAETGFQLGPAQFSAEGRISALRLLPTAKPLQPAQMRNAFEIGGVAVIPNETRARVQLTPAGTTPMTMQLFAHLELNAVELTPNFQVAQLILNWPTNAVGVTLSPKVTEQTAARFEMRIEKLDSSGRIAALLLSPIR